MKNTYGYLILLNENNVFFDSQLQKWVSELKMKKSTRFTVEQYIEGVERTLGRKLSGELLDSVRSIGELIVNDMKNQCILRKSDGFILIGEDVFSISNIVQRALSLSANVSYPIIYLSGFDKSVFMFGIARQGQIITQHHIGDGLEEFGIPVAHGDLTEIKNVLKNVDKDQIDKFLLEQDIFCVEKEIEDIFFKNVCECENYFCST